MAAGDGKSYTLKDFEVTTSFGVVDNKTSLTINTKNRKIQRNTGEQGFVIWDGDDPPEITLEFIMGSGQHFDMSGIQGGYPVEVFDVVSIQDGDADMLANLQARWPVDGTDQKWVWDDANTNLTPDAEGKVSIKIQPGCIKWRT